MYGIRTHPIHRAVQVNDINRIRSLLEDGIDPDHARGTVNGETSLLYATLYNDIDTIQLLLEYGADPNISDNEGETALMYASLSGHIDIVELLLSIGVNPYVEDNSGNTALIWALREGQTEIVELLKSHMDTDVFDSPSSPDIQQLREEATRAAAIRIQSRIKGRQTRRKLTKKKPRYGKMAKPTTEREKM